jgi:glycosyltransferase involved in cell wall biosynthesis
MRIGFFTDTFLPQRNGVVTSLLEFGREFSMRGHEVHVFCPKTSVRKVSGMRVHSYPSVRFRPYPEYKIAVPRGKDRAPELDVVHTHSPFSMGVFGLRVAKHQGLPRVSTFHTLLSEYLDYVFRIGKRLMKGVTWRWCRFFYNRHDAVVVPSRAMLRILRERGVSKPIKIIPTGIDTERFRPVPQRVARKRLGLKAKGKIFLYLGRLGYEKKIEVIIQAMARVEATLLVAGRGPALRSLKALVRREGLGARVKFVGFVPEGLKPLYLSAADATVIASESETQGIVPLESMACGTPVIAARAMALPEVIKDGVNGLLFPPGDSEALADLLSSFDRKEEFCSAALRTARSYSRKRFATAMLRLYREVRSRDS